MAKKKIVAKARPKGPKKPAAKPAKKAGKKVVKAAKAKPAKAKKAAPKKAVAKKSAPAPKKMAKKAPVVKAAKGKPAKAQKKVAAKPSKSARPASVPKPAAKQAAPSKAAPAKVVPAKAAVAKTTAAAPKPEATKAVKAAAPVAAPTKPAPVAKPKAPPAPPREERPLMESRPMPAVASATSKKPLKEKVTIEFEVRSSPAVLYELISSPSGFAEWYCTDVNVRGDQYTFIWPDEQEETTLIGRKLGEVIRFHRNNDDDEASYFEFRVRIDAMTNEVALIVTDHAWPAEIEETRNLWSSQIASLMRVLGA